MRGCLKTSSSVLAVCVVCCSIVWTQETLHAYVQTEERLGEAPPIAFAYIDYLRGVTGIAKVPNNSKPEEANSFALVCVGGAAYIAPKSEFLKLPPKPNTRQTALLAGPTRADREAAHDTSRGIAGDFPGGLIPDDTNVGGGVLSSEPGLPGISGGNRVRVSRGVMRTLLMTKVNPSYPPEAEKRSM